MTLSWVLLIKKYTCDKRDCLSVKRPCDICSTSNGFVSNNIHNNCPCYVSPPTKIVPNETMSTVSPLSILTKAYFSTGIKRVISNKIVNKFDATACAQSRCFECNLRMENMISFGEATCLWSSQSVWILEVMRYVSPPAETVPNETISMWVLQQKQCPRNNLYVSPPAEGMSKRQYLCESSSRDSVQWYNVYVSPPAETMMQAGTSGSILAEISDRSPRKLCILII